jgi:hypothetical protein
MGVSCPEMTSSVVVFPPPLGPHQVDAVQHLDAAVGGPHPAELEQGRLGGSAERLAHPAPR